MERVVVIGCAGSGKSTLAIALAQRTGLRLVERDGLGRDGSPERIAALHELARDDRWILDGAPYWAEQPVYDVADTVVFLDYRRSLVMWRVLRRTLRVELTGRAAGAHRRSGLGVLRDLEHPLRWAWTSHADRRREGSEVRTRLADGATFVHLRTPADAARWLAAVQR